MKTSFSFRDRVKRELQKARNGMKLPAGTTGSMSGNLIFTHSEVQEILEDLDRLVEVEKAEAEEKMRCTICGFIVDTRYEAEFPQPEGT